MTHVQTLSISGDHPFSIFRSYSSFVFVVRVASTSDVNTLSNSDLFSRLRFSIVCRDGGEVSANKNK